MYTICFHWPGVAERTGKLKHFVKAFSKYQIFQILHGGGPDWLEREEGNGINEEVPRAAPPDAVDNVQEPLDDENGNNNEEVFNNNNNNNVLDANLHPNDVFPNEEPMIGPQLPPQPAQQMPLPEEEPPAAPAPPPNNNFEIPQHNPINNAEPPLPDNEEVQAEPQENLNGEDPNEGIWNPMEFGPNGAELELTWERLLGLDGSMVFLEHV